MPEEFLDLTRIDCFMEILKSAEFRQALDFMGRYRIDKPGDVITFRNDA